MYKINKKSEVRDDQPEAHAESVLKVAFLLRNKNKFIFIMTIINNCE